MRTRSVSRENKSSVSVLSKLYRDLVFLCLSRKFALKPLSRVLMWTFCTFMLFVSHSVCRGLYPGNITNCTVFEIFSNSDLIQQVAPLELPKQEHKSNLQNIQVPKIMLLFFFFFRCSTDSSCKNTFKLCFGSCGRSLEDLSHLPFGIISILLWLAVRDGSRRLLPSRGLYGYRFLVSNTLLLRFGLEVENLFSDCLRRLFHPQKHPCVNLRELSDVSFRSPFEC